MCGIAGFLRRSDAADVGEVHTSGDEANAADLLASADADALDELYVVECLKRDDWDEPVDSRLGPIPGGYGVWLKAHRGCVPHVRS